MKYENFFKDKFESIPEYRKIVLLILSIKNDVDLIKECGYLKKDINPLNLECKNILMEQNEEYLDHIKNQEESKIEKKY